MLIIEDFSADRWTFTSTKTGLTEDVVKIRIKDIVNGVYMGSSAHYLLNKKELIKLRAYIDEQIQTMKEGEY